VDRTRIQSYRDLDAWQVSMDLCLLVYTVVKALPENERFGLSSQMRRSAVSVPSNVAEGQACGEDGRYVHHLRIALGSLGELSTQMEIARRLMMLPDKVIGKADEHLARTGQILHGLLRSRLKKRRLHAAGSALLTCLALWWLGVPVLG
jgi:four helix bundle protein